MTPAEESLRPVGRPLLRGRRNSLNLFRLVLALVVLVSHAYPIAGRPEPSWQGEHLGTWAVAGFFMISGYLITAARLRTHFSEYLVHRIARIFPAFVVSLVVTVVLVAPVGYLHANRTLDGYLTTPNTPFNYVFSNLLLRIPDFSVAGTPTGVPLPGAWNGSLWTLYYEFLCYLIIGLVMLWPLAKRSVVPVAVLFVASVAAHANLDALLPYLGPNPDLLFLAPLLPYFLGGALVHQLRQTIPGTWPVGVGSGVVGLLLIVLVPGWGGQVAAPLLTVATLWLASVVPSPELLRRHDVSYGVYIYTFPVQQLLVLVGLHRWMPAYLVVTTLLVLVPAVASWLLVERPVMTHVRTYDTRQVRAMAQEEPAI
ncbi:acyltransferase family protein [Sanguibacter suaedae]|uniref:Acyltransferase n=1 Tax=Sanguibacter suaedae TaxID=2795737 RepID=A0A934IBA6_9MICO|nr:acyltransferase family protein [Sanguibacter suaedae]MBI9114788.1 acyltransferase [Sanguibacter suaedae]